MTDDFSDVQQSYGRCLRTGNFIDRFYEVLMDSHPDMRAAFARTDFGTQRRALRRGISNAILYAAGSDVVKRQVDELANVHSRAGRAPVAPELYPFWISSLMKVVAEADPQFAPRLEVRWRQALKPLIERFVAEY